MSGIEASNRRMRELLNVLAASEGRHPSILDSVHLMRAEQPMARNPVLQEPCIVIVAQGLKRGYLGDQVFTYDRHNYLVISVPMPFECESEVGPDGPMLAFSIRIDFTVLIELMLKIDHKQIPLDGNGPHGMYSTPLDLSLCEAAVRLLESLASPLDAEVLGPGIIREIIYRVLCGENGASLRALMAVNGHLGQIQRVLNRMHADYSQSFEVADLADEAGMSVSAFHHTFKAVTSTSPLQYLKTIRLHKARMLMVQEGVGVGVAADRVGYESTSQFSREFKRLFGATPLEETGRLRAMLGLNSPHTHVGNQKSIAGLREMKSALPRTF